MVVMAQVALGGALGALARYGVGLAAGALWPGGFPWATLIVNILGSFLMGLAVVWVGVRPGWAPFLMVGVLGGFTTFSAFSLDVVRLMEAGQLARAAGYAGASLVVSVLALLAGSALALRTGLP